MPAMRSPEIELPLVLLVDDDDDIRDALEDVCRRAGYPTASLRNGQQAIDLLRRRSAPCVMVLDLMMPVMDGHEVLRLVAAEQLPVQVIVLSASGNADSVPPETRFVAKPIARDRLLAEIAEAAAGILRP